MRKSNRSNFAPMGNLIERDDSSLHSKLNLFALDELSSELNDDICRAFHA